MKIIITVIAIIVFVLSSQAQAQKNWTEMSKKDAEKILNDSLKRLKPGGEIHIVDSNLYRQSEISAARLRSNEYYKAIGFPEMSDQYFHHPLVDLKLFNHNILYDPHSIINKLKKNKNPFYWVCIRNNA